MPNQQLNVSPLTGERVPYVVEMENSFAVTFKHEQDGFSDFRLTEALMMKLRLYGETYIYETRDEHYNLVRHSASDTNRAFDLIRSMLWRQNKLGQKPLIVTDKDDYQAHTERLAAKGHTDYFRVRVFDDVLAQAKNLTFRQYALQTLYNIWIAWQASDLRKPFFIDGTAFDGDKHDVKFGHYKNIHIVQDLAFPIDKYICYGCSLASAPYVYQYLFDFGLIRLNVGSGLGFQISSTGFEVIDDIEHGANSDVISGFFIRRWNEAQDTFLNGVMAEVCSELGIDNISPVWAKEHNDKIDERIFRLIRQASIVVVDCTGERYNVGLEHGYAMALGKPIVLIRERAEVWVAPPFDISTQNCYDYQTDDAGRQALKGKLSARIGLALDDMNRSRIYARPM